MTSRPGGSTLQAASPSKANGDSSAIMSWPSPSHALPVFLSPRPAKHASSFYSSTPGGSSRHSPKHQREAPAKAMGVVAAATPLQCGSGHRPSTSPIGRKGVVRMMDDPKGTGVPQLPVPYASAVDDEQPPASERVSVTSSHHHGSQLTVAESGHKLPTEKALAALEYDGGGVPGAAPKHLSHKHQLRPADSAGSCSGRPHLAVHQQQQNRRFFWAASQAPPRGRMAALDAPSSATGAFTQRPQTSKI